MKPQWEQDKSFPKDEPVWYMNHDTGYYVVGKSPGGDWYCGWNPETDPAITDDTFQYFDSWQAARKYCESLTCHNSGAPT